MGSTGAGPAGRGVLGLPRYSRAESRGVLLVVGAALSGLAAELVMDVVGRWRPGDTGDYHFDWFPPIGLRNPGEGFVSSHVAVACGAVCVMARFFPDAARPLYLYALGCALTRMLAGAHFATDCFGAAVLAYVLVAGMFRLPFVVDVLEATGQRYSGARLRHAPSVAQGWGGRE